MFLPSKLPFSTVFSGEVSLSNCTKEYSKHLNVAPFLDKSSSSMCDERKKHYFPNNRENIEKRLSYSNIKIRCVHITSRKLSILLRTCAVPLPILFRNLDMCPAALVEYTISKQIKSMLVRKIRTHDYAQSTLGSFYKKNYSVSYLGSRVHIRKKKYIYIYPYLPDEIHKSTIATL